MDAVSKTYFASTENLRSCELLLHLFLTKSLAKYNNYEKDYAQNDPLVTCNSKLVIPANTTRNIDRRKVRILLQLTMSVFYLGFTNFKILFLSLFYPSWLGWFCVVQFIALLVSNNCTNKSLRLGVVGKKYFENMKERAPTWRFCALQFGVRRYELIKS